MTYLKPPEDFDSPSAGERFLINITMQISFNINMWGGIFFGSSVDQNAASVIPCSCASESIFSWHLMETMDHLIFEEPLY
jgi:hypothetical protein